MKELLLWLIGTQKINSLDSTLTCSIRDGGISGLNSIQVLNDLLLMDSVEKAELLAKNSGSLRTVRALWFALQLLKNLDKEDQILAYSKMEYPYKHLVEKGKLLDDEFINEDEEEDE